MNRMSLHFEKTIENWDEALPLGNGDIGCLIWNRSDCLRFSLDKGGIWDCSEPPEEQKDFTYAKSGSCFAAAKNGSCTKNTTIATAKRRRPSCRPAS